MFGVDKGDQYRARGGGFANKAHFKKWYKKIYLGLLDIMLLNAWALYNMCAAEQRAAGDVTLGRLQHHEVLTFLAECMLNFKDDDSPPTPEAVRERKKLLQEIRGEHRPVEANNAMKQNKVRCTVCRLENYIDPVNVSEAGLKKKPCKV